MVCTNDFCLDILYYMFIHIENYDNIPVTFSSFNTTYISIKYKIKIYFKPFSVDKQLKH